MGKFNLDFYRGKKVLVTGHTGFKGTWLCRLLLGARAEVTGYSLEPPTDPALFSLAGMDRQMDSVTGERNRRLSFIWQPSPLSGNLTGIRCIPMRRM